MLWAHSVDQGRICRNFQPFFIITGSLSLMRNRSVSCINPYRIRVSVKYDEKVNLFWNYVLIFPSLLSLQPSSHLSVCLSLYRVLLWMKRSHTRTHSSSTACCMVWAADISLQAICQSELDVLAWSHTNTPNHTHTNMPNLQWMNEGFFRPVYLIIHMCLLDSCYVTLHSLLWLAAI